MIKNNFYYLGNDCNSICLESLSKTVVLQSGLLPDISIKEKRAFTLAETLITLTILGVIAAITVPGLVRHQIEAANRTKIKKAMRVYDFVMNKMTVENGIKNDTALKNFAGDENNNCAGSSSYFKIAEGSGCRFKTSDGVWWDISDINRVIIALKEEDLNKATADSDTNRAFYLLSWFDDNGTLRIDDLAAATGGDKATIAKMYNFISGKTQTSKAEVANEPIAEKSSFDKWKDGAYDDYPIYGPGYDQPFDFTCTSCKIWHYGGNDFAKHIIDENGKEIGLENIPAYSTTNVSTDILTFIEYHYNDEGKVETISLYNNSGLITTIPPQEFDTTARAIDPSGNLEEYYECTNSGCLNMYCFVQGTQITLADGSKKTIEDIDFNDALKVWDFDNGCSTCSKPIWIRKETIAKQHTVLTFSNGKQLKIITNHSIFNVDEGKFTYPVEGMRTVFEDGSIAVLEKKEIVEYPVKYYNVVTENHLNMYANDILVSCRLNNMYPIKNMKFVKDDRELIPYEEFEGIPYEWYQKLRLAEQPRDINRDGKLYLGKDVREYVLQMITSNKRQMALV